MGFGGWEIPSFPSCGVGSGGWESPPVVWGLLGWTQALVGSNEASLMRQTIFCGRRFCVENLGCRFKWFGRPWRFVLGTIRCRVIKSVLMTSTPQEFAIRCAIYCTLYTLEFVLYTMDYNVKFTIINRVPIIKFRRTSPGHQYYKQY